MKSYLWWSFACLVAALVYVLLVSRITTDGSFALLLAFAVYFRFTWLLRPDPSHFQVPRRQRFARVVLPASIILLVAASLQARLAPGLERYDLVGFDSLSEHERRTELVVSSWFWRITTKPPTVVSPDGESHVLTGYPLIWGLPVMMYNPYEAHAAWGKEFLGYQLSRALKDACDLDLTSQEALGRYVVNGYPYRLWGYHPEIVGKTYLASVAINPLVLTLFPLLFFGGAIILRKGPKTLWRRFGQIILVLGCNVSVLVAFGAPPPLRPTWSGDIVFRIEVLRGEGARILHEHPIFVFGIWLIVAVGLYRFIERRYEHIELPQVPT